MQRRLIVFVLLMMLTVTALGPYIPSLETPPSHDDTYSLGPRADPILAADGGMSSESIISFSETLDDDVLHYPDAIQNLTEEVPNATNSTDWGSDGGPTLSPPETMWYVDSTYSEASASYPYDPPAKAAVTVNFSLPSALEISGFQVNMYAQSIYTTEAQNISIYAYDFTSSSWELIQTWSVPADHGWQWFNTTSRVTDASCYPDEVYLKIYVEDLDSGNVEIWVDYIGVSFWYMTGSVSSESFADVSDWSALGTNPDSSFSTDGDVATIVVDFTATNDAETWKATTSLSGNAYYLEGRWYCNSTDADFIGVYIYTDESNFWYYQDWSEPTSWETFRRYIPLLSTVGSPTDVNYVKLYIRGDAPKSIEVYIDYLRIARADQMGWQHDCSTTAGVEGSATSDGDLLTISTSANFTVDTTDTATMVSATYYPFIEINVDSGTGTAYLLDGSTWDTLGSLSAGANRFNVKAVASEYQKINVTGTNIVLDYVKGYSIANFTVEQSGLQTDDVVYVDSGNLVFDGGVAGTSTYMRLNLDTTISVSSSTYNIWNITCSGDIDEIQMRELSDTAYWHTQGETRGTIASSTLTDFIVYYYGTATLTLSAIKFWADHTAPTVVRSFATPPSPDDTTAVTLSAVITDSVGVYRTYFDAIVSPSAFSDTAYYATEQSDNLWTYTFDTLPTGYYCFKIVATDGANENALTEYAYISLTVSESEIRVDAITFFGASSDFSYMQLSGWINKKCSYTIREWSESYPITETHTGTVNEGIFNIAWDKLGVTDTNANFTITFTNGTQTYTIMGSYQTAYKQLQILNIVVNVPESSSTVDTNITVSFYTNKQVNYYVYQDDTLVTSGTVNEGLGTISWAKDTATGGHDYNIKWTDGVSTYWYNSSYYVYQHNIDNIEPKGSFSPSDLRTSDIYWQNFLLLVILGGLVVLWFKDDTKNKRIGDLPNYGRRTRR